MADNIMDDNKKKKQKKTPRIKHKKLIILFSAILVVAAVFIIKAFSSKHYALAEETDSFEKERPTSGNPLDYSGLDNAAICNWVIRHTEEFKSVTTGTVSAKVAVINYKQDIHNTRIVTKDGCYIETISDSSLVHVYEEKFLQNNQVVVRKNHSDKYQTITNDVFLEKYGWHPKEFQAYILNEETIRDAKIEAAENGNYTLTLDLDPVKAVPKKQRETKTIGGAKGYPGYKETVLTITLSSDWTPIEVDTYEVYDIGMPGIGDITCKCNMEEKIEYGLFEIPDKEAFKAHINDVATDLEEGEKDVIGYLQEIFGPLIQGNMNDFKISVDALDTKLEGDLNIKLEASGVKVNADISDIFVSYQGNDVYIKLGENKYKLNINDLNKYLKDNNSSSALTSAIDLNSLLSQVQNAEIIKNGNDVTINIKLDLMGIKANAAINASLSGDTYKFKDIYATVDVFGKSIVLTMKPSEKHTYPIIDDSYEDIANMFFIIDEVKSLINKPLEINLETTVKDIKINANVLYNNGLASGIIKVNDKYEINIYYNNETVYANFDNLYFKFNINDINKFSDKTIDLGNVSIKLTDILDVIKSLNIDITGEKAFDLSIDLSKYVELLKDFKISVYKDDALNVVISKYNLKLSIKETEKEVLINPDVEYNDVANVTWLIDIITKAINYDAYNFAINLTYKDVIVSGNIYLDKDLNVSATLNIKYKDYEFNDIKAYFIDNELYISLFNIKVKASIEDILALVGDVKTSNIDIDSLLEGLLIKLDENKLDISANLSSITSILGNVNLTVNKDSSVIVKAEDLVSSIKLTETTKEIITINKDEYLDFSLISFLVDDIKEALNYDGYSFNISATYKDLKVDGNIYLNKDLEVEALLNVNYSGLEINNIKLIYKNKNIYVSFGKTSIMFNINDINGIIAEINTQFGLNISTDSIKTDFDINSILNNITIDAITNKLMISADLSSISSLLSNVNINIEKGLKFEVSASDVLIDATLIEDGAKEVVMPVANINKDELDLLIEYAKQLKDIVEKWRYNIGFELHVNGYDVYARANIVTFKPDKGLSLYGKVILVKGDKKYYIEASIIENVAFLNFSQTITNFNSSNPINSTTTQSIKFKINFNELIDVANYALDALNIDNDTIKMAITYLGTIVNTNGDFDELYDDISSKVKTIDLSMVKDIINLNEIELLVNSDYLTIDLGNNTENNLQTFKVFRTGGVVSGLDVVDFEINNDILNGHFELLENEDITAANYAGCLDFNGIGNLVKAGLNNYNNGELALSGSVSMSLLGLNLSAGVDLDCMLDFDHNGKLRGYIYLDISKLGIDFLGLLIKKDTKTYIYIQDDMIYIKRVAGSTETRKMSLSDFGKDALEQIIWIFNFGSTVANAIRNAEKADPKIEEVLKSYSGSNNTYKVTLDGAKLVGSNIFGDINLQLKTTKIEDMDYLSTISADATLAAVLGLDVNITVNNSPIDWSFYPSDATLNGYTTYTI
ncbi:MAG: hypothetical protein K6E87_05965 [bacterium]|nr:hypothetical protein [bacterium]